MYYIWDAILSSNLLAMNGDALTFLSQTEAYAYLDKRRYDQDRFKVKFMCFDIWCIRERENLASGVYVQPVWHRDPWYQERFEDIRTFAHVSQKNPMLIAYTENASKGNRDIKNVISPGKFLHKYFGDIFTSDDITKQVDRHREAFASPPVLMWAITPEEIEKVYSIPATFESCMQDTKDRWELPVHPTAVYGAGDLSVAYLMQGERLIARALVWKDRNLVGRVYGDAALLRKALADYGIVTLSNNAHYDEFHGAKILKIEAPKSKNRERVVYGPTIIAPHIDGYACALRQIDDKHLMIIDPEWDEKGDICTMEQWVAKTQGGVFFSGCKCGRCSKWAVFTTDHIITSVDSQIEYSNHWCGECSDSTSFVCHATGLVYSSDTFTKGEMKRYNFGFGEVEVSPYCVEVSEGHVFTSVRTGDVWKKSDQFEMGNGEIWALQEAFAFGFTSSIDHHTYPIEDKVQVGNYLVTKDQLKEMEAYNLFPEPLLDAA